MKRKQFETGIRQIAQEGAIQIFHEPNTGLEEVIVGVVGVLQFDVLEYRLQSEYSTAVRRRALPYENIRWIVSDTDRNSHAHARHQVGAGLQGQQPPALRRRVEHRLHAQAEPRPRARGVLQKLITNAQITRWENSQRVILVCCPAIRRGDLYVRKEISQR